MIGESLVSDKEREFIIKCLPAKGSLLEIGTYHGVTAALVAQARPEVGIICVDPFDNDPDDDGAQGDRDKWYANAQPNMGLFIGTAQQFAEGSCPAFDVAFIDGNHAFGACISDLMAVAPMVKPGGVILCHDYGRIAGERVTKAVDLFVKGCWKIEGRVHYTVALRRA